MVTLKDVALKANVSKMTVSRVINHPELVTDELKTLVHQAMEELGYKPNTVARALAQNRTMIVKVLILEEMDSTEPYYMHLIKGIAEALDQYHYALQLVTENTYELGGGDGYIITGMTREDYDWVKEIQAPLIIFGENDIHLPFVDSDNQKAVETITTFAMTKGYEHYIYVGMDVPELFAASRKQGFLNAMVQATSQTYEIYQVKNSAMAAEQLLQAMTFEPNTCFICATDRIALGIQRGLKNQRLNLSDYGITGFDGVFLDCIASPKLTTMKQDIEYMGKKCVQLLMERIDGKQLQSVANFCDATLIERETLRK
ncbi:LacI family DNA-binding transcriptional regulator [Tuanshanicoccus lijuaniae]|uniref:LacI family DNA-binding transcriptional regulator n=1 Tax=Aerococcaceae bacterium zg-1292 TaxID=2774330 RepID=UPI001936E392|nr:LacI family DNA-binding transcriptional regulator [Aerococcaceae bacterium zg-1292]MBD3949484.1 LacI family DNA-binding transcriptional regulator [Aerococcaceae bacterium zg-1292]QQA36501.1 LacI family DNA-binding transcriptional regulator [Aerococcaceae bacterium zg-1292]